MQSSFRFLHAADIHLDSPLHGLAQYEDAPVDEIRGATRDAFRALIDLAIEERVAFVLLAGDLYDGDWPDFNTGLFFVAQMNRLREAGIAVHLVSGNHDAASHITRGLRLPDNVTHHAHDRVQTVVHEDLGVAIHGQSYPTGAVGEDLSAGYPLAEPGRFEIGLLHTSLDGRPPHAEYAPCTLGGLRTKGYQYWALGHVHGREVVSEDPWVVFPGNTQGRNVREPGAKGCTIVSVDAGRIVSVEHRDVDVLRWAIAEVDVSDADTPEATLDAVHAALETHRESSAGRPLAVRLVLTGRSPAHADLRRDAERWTNEYRALASGLATPRVWIEKVRFETKDPVDLDEALSRDDALGDLVRSVMAAGDEGDDLDGLAALLEPMRAKLPHEIRQGDDPVDPTDPDYLKSALPRVRDLLLARLLDSGGEAT